MGTRRLPRTRGFLLSGLLLALALPAQAQKKPLDHDVYDIWNRIVGQAISDDGNWVLYHLVSEEYDPTLVVRSTSSATEHRVERGEAARFTDDARFVVFRLKPSKEAVKQAEKEKKKPDEMPQDSLGILDLSDGSIVRVERVRSFEMPEDNGQWLAYLLLKEVEEPDTAQAEEEPAEPEPEEPAAGEEEEEEKPDKKREDGTTLVFRNLANGAEQRIDFVTDYEFSEDGGKLVYVTSTEDASGDGAYLLTTATGQIAPLATGAGHYKSIAIDESGNRIAFLSDRNDYEADEPAFDAYYWDGSAAEAEVAASATTPGVPEGWWVSDNQAPSFSHDGTRLFVGTAPRPEPEPEEDEEDDDEEEVVVDIWAWTDPLLQPNQLNQLERDRRQTYQAMVDLQDGSFVQLATMDVPNVLVSDQRDGDVILGRSNLPYRKLISWGESGNDLYLVDPETGAKELVVEYVIGQSNLSPEGKYLYWFDAETLQWMVMDVATRNVVDVSSAIGQPMHNELDDHPQTPGAHGVAGWTDGDAQMLVYDRYDIWALDPTGRTAPRNLTEGVGRRENMRFRYIDLDRERPGIDPDADMMLSAFDYWTKQSGFYRDRFRGASPPARLVFEDAAFGSSFRPIFTKAEDADRVIFNRSTFQDFPNIWVSDLSLSNPVQLSDANPQQADYLWGTAELVEWRSAADSEPLQGILYKPENFDPSQKYPMMVYFYERSSDGLHGYTPPAPGSSSINRSFYVSRGYLLFVPDIPYQVGYPGESALEAVVPGVLSLIEKGFVDEDRIGVQGHSWGGYQIAYMVTKTNIFAAAEAGAPVSNMISAYGGIRWGSGLSRMMQYEKTQSRIGGPLWDETLRFIENSPIFFADKVETPLLMLHNDQDGAVPWEQGIEYFVSLRRLNKPAWMFNYNGEDHGLRQRHNQKDWTIRLQQFFDHYLKDAPPPVWMVEGVPAIKKGKTLGLELVTDPKKKIISEGSGGGR